MNLTNDKSTKKNGLTFKSISTFISQKKNKLLETKLFSFQALIIILFSVFIYIFLKLGESWINNKLFPNSLTINQNSTSPANPQELLLQKTAESPCNTTNLFEESIWQKKDSFRVLTENPDTKEPEYFGAKTTPPYQSQMIFPFECSLPLISTTSAIISSEQSAGIQFEYEGVFQVILGDGDLKAVRYKKDTLGTRKEGWLYLKNSQGKKITHWLEGNITPGTEIYLTTKIETENNQIKLTVIVDYKPQNNENYIKKELEPVYLKVNSYNIQKNPGKRIRIGINDEKFEGTQAKIKFLKFQLHSLSQ